MKTLLIIALLAAPAQSGPSLTLIINGNEYCPLTEPLRYEAGQGTIYATVDTCTFDRIHSDRFEE